MTVSVVLRLTPAALDAGRLAGEAEVVATGERATVRDADELIRFVRQSSEAGAPVSSGGQVERSEQRGG